MDDALAMKIRLKYRIHSRHLYHIFFSLHQKVLLLAVGNVYKCAIGVEMTKNLFECLSTHQNLLALCKIGIK